MTDIILQEKIRNKILLIRDQRVMLDRDLAEFYEIDTKVLNQAVKRNSDRFPGDFMFRLTKAEKEHLVTNCDHLSDLKYSYQSPYVFTEMGIAMLSSVLKSKRAVIINIAIMRVFVMVSRIINSSKDLAEKIGELEKKYDRHDKKIKDIFSALHGLIKNRIKEEANKPEIGFKV
ncbi:MAG: ORF6N domain-containing protein [bacterium]|nr:ORF6N domain-containing protein [bacterium]